MSDLHNESIFITGGGSGLGLALVERFIEEGAQVATLELSAAKVASLRQRFGEHILAVEDNVTCYAEYLRPISSGTGGSQLPGLLRDSQGNAA